MTDFRWMGAACSVLFVVACAAFAGCETDDGPACGPVYDHFVDGATDCSNADDPIVCRDDAESNGDAWLIRYRQGSIDGGEGLDEYLIGTANEMHLGTAPYAAARGEHLSQHYVVAACHDLELMDNVWLSHTCVDAVTLCNE